MRAIALMLLTAVALCGCIRSNTTQLSDDRAIISARGGASYDLADIQKRMLQDAAKLTLQSGFDYFTIIDASGGYATAYVATPGYSQSTTTFDAYSTPNTVSGTANTYNYTTPSVISPVQKPRGSISIRMFHGVPPEGDPNSFDALSLLQHVGE